VFVRCVTKMDIATLYVVLMVEFKSAPLVSVSESGIMTTQFKMSTCLSELWRF
jgi:hypothetical protein